RTVGRHYSWDVPGQPIPTTVSSFVEATWDGEHDPDGHSPNVQRLPPAGRDGPAVHFVSDAPLFDLDPHGNFPDVSDVVRLARAIAGNDRTGDLHWLDLDHDGRLTDRDLRQAAGLLILSRPEPVSTNEPVSGFHADDGGAVIEFADASRLTIPRGFS